jgi:uncharacterized lipoprotein NlpE involved in copper resistance
MLKLVAMLLVAALVVTGCNNDNAADPASASADADLPTGSGMATVSWEAPSTTTAGTALSNLSGYRIYYGVSEDDLSQVVDVGVNLQTYAIDNLGSGTWYFAVRAVTQLGVESELSQIVSKTIG